MEDVVQKGLAYLSSVQLSDGGFASHSSPANGLFTPQLEYRTVFFPAVILGALADVDLPTAVTVRKGLSKFLNHQESARGTFNYFTRSTLEYDTFAYPDDLDDTFVALGALAHDNHEELTPVRLANAVKILLSNEVRPGGPYRTWMVSGDAPEVWRDVDPVVNCNIATFLGVQYRVPESLQNYLEQFIKSGHFKSPYYVGSAPVLYFLARAYQGPLRPELQRVIQATLAQASNSLERALLLGASDHASSAELEKLQNSQRADGSWPAAAFCCDPSRDGRQYAGGSAALTTAIAIEALQKHSPTAAQTSSGSDALDTLHREIVEVVREFCGSMPRVMHELLNRVTEGDVLREITLLPLLCAQALRTTISPKTSRDLGVASLCGWLAYTIFDDFLDGAGQTELLPAALGLLRKTLSIFAEHLPQPLVEKVFATMDAANSWELAHCRQLTSLPNYADKSKLAERSQGHVLSSLAVLSGVGLTMMSPEVLAFREGFSHYLIARQLCDDLHDWPEDYKDGHASYVVCAVLEELVSPVTKARMREVFWAKTLPRVCSEIREHLTRARQYFAQISQFESPNIYTDLLDRLEAVVKNSLSEQRQAEAFLEYYMQTD